MVEPNFVVGVQTIWKLDYFPTFEYQTLSSDFGCFRNSGVRYSDPAYIEAIKVSVSIDLFGPFIIYNL